MNPITMQLAADKYIRLALEEDINSEDVTTNSVMPEYKKGEVQLICKEDGIIAGLPIFERVFLLLDPRTKVTFDVKDGDRVEKGRHLATVTGDIRVLLSGERTALNYLQRMSGIATYTNTAVSYTHLDVYKRQGESIDTAIEYATIAAGISTTRLGAQSSLPDRYTLEMYRKKLIGRIS